MPASVTVSKRTIFGNKKVCVGTVAFDSSYPTGGEAVSYANLGLANVDFVQVSSAAGYVFEYDHTNKKVKAYWVDTTTDGAAMAEVADTTDLSAVTARFFAFGN